MRLRSNKSTAKPVPSTKAAVKTSISLKHDRKEPDVSEAQSSNAKLPHERDESVGKEVAKPSEKMQQAHRDLSRGLQDTDRGPVADRAYKKLKQ